MTHNYPEHPEWQTILPVVRLGSSSGWADLHDVVGTLGETSRAGPENVGAMAISQAIAEVPDALSQRTQLCGGGCVQT